MTGDFLNRSGTPTPACDNDAALAKAPDYIDVLNDKGFTLQRLGDLLLTAFEGERGDEGLRCLRRALQVFSRSLELAPN